ncbi:hypothetical protein OG723_44410 (plasmid) [Streptomyces sp. NBC_01278]|uniref:hypothetical protein n=1 Tax=Streptomyces sp. NBC_01278 TaxID=2903809 RepID=UPI002E3530A8|nr:hypothetical protein [Streptomyces sp. NBC_01278]
MPTNKTVTTVHVLAIGHRHSYTLSDSHHMRHALVDMHEYGTYALREYDVVDREGRPMRVWAGVCGTGRVLRCAEEASPYSATDFHISDATAVLTAAGLTVLDPGSKGTGVVLHPVENFTDAVEVRPVVNGLENCPMGAGDFNERRAEWVCIMAAARTALTETGWERWGETPRYGRFLAHTPLVRTARTVLAAAGVPLLPRGYQDGRGAFVHPADGKPRTVRIVVHAGGFRYKPGPDRVERESEGAQQWRDLMRECFDVMHVAGWQLEHAVIHDSASFHAPARVDVPERPTIVLGCDPEEDEHVQAVARILRERGYPSLAAAKQQTEGTAWGFTVLSTAYSSDVMVTYDHNRPAPMGAPYRREELGKVRAMLAAYKRTLSRHGMTFGNEDPEHVVLWVKRPASSGRARIVLADNSGFAWLPELAARYRYETRPTADAEWEVQGEYPKDKVLSHLELALRKGWTTAEAEGRTIYTTITEPSDWWPYGRYVPLDES